MSIFSKVKIKRPKRSTFNLSHNSKLTLPMGQLIPVYWNYFEPNTTFSASSIIQCRTMPMMAPIMHEVNIYSYWFQYPIRLGMNPQDYEDFITGGREGTSVVNYPKYLINAGDLSTIANGGALLDYLDFPMEHVKQLENWSSRPLQFDAMPFRAYGEIYNSYFRDENTTAEYNVSKFTGTRSYSDSEWTDTDIDMMKTKPRCWTKDYFTSALPWAQRGGNVDVPFTVLSELVMDGKSPSLIQGYPANAGNSDQSAYMYLDSKKGTEVHDGVTTDVFSLASENNQGTKYDALQLDVTRHTKVNNTVSAGTINDLRTAFTLQRWKERNAIGGSRYIEQINAHFGVWADDFRLQRPLYLGGSRVPLQISEVLQTSESTDTSQQGNPSGRGYSLDSQGHVKCFVKEHSIIMNLICIVPKATYYQGLPRKFDIRDKFDFPWPMLGHLGEQEVRNSEIFYQANNTDDGTFGYQSRYSQYKYEPNRQHGEFNNTLQFWTLARKFNNLPTLSKQFMEVRENSNGLDRIFPVLTDDDVYYGVSNHYWAQINFNIRVKRPLPYFGTPNL